MKSIKLIVGLAVAGGVAAGTLGLGAGTAAAEDAAGAAGSAVAADGISGVDLQDRAGDVATVATGMPRGICTMA